MNKIVFGIIHIFNLASIKKFLAAAFIFGLIFQNISAQQVSASAKLDSTLILIGGQIDLKLEVSQPEGIKINFPVFNDTIIKSVEIVDKGQIDTLRMDNNRLVLSQLYRITSFDSGLHYIPPIQFELIDGELKKSFKTEAMSLMVVNPFKEVNPEKGIFDIKGVQDSPFKLAEILDYIYLYGGIVLILALLTWLFLYYRRKRQGKGSVFINTKPDEPAHVIAMRELDKIKNAKLWEHNKVKEFYTLLSNTLREYIENRYQIPALEKTSIEILNEMESTSDIDKAVIKQLNQVLELSDLVKFAKFQPLADENSLSLMNAYFFVDKTKENVIKTLEQEKEDILDKESKSDN